LLERGLLLQEYKFTFIATHHHLKHLQIQIPKELPYNVTKVCATQQFIDDDVVLNLDRVDLEVKGWSCHKHIFLSQNPKRIPRPMFKGFLGTFQNFVMFANQSIYSCWLHASNWRYPTKCERKCA
jgi:hypothetical protein